ncbi:U4/U6.U5 tri-snRNP-associated protein 2, putative [Plasmodium gallinaceum]|uniref:U4/U6.U5 tri-snRNP-associated protein 2, putative n=1 Tax=Plasmodium gallinaceum TaxID=5849 RepID=A0A1J1GYM7_PLAGA|nr:U4/U6.U5 tri-snRNP-associated protein 2, putative [Plasmodium gallinaceum]CRG97560.1 U4/U6.U5 tri-snRNP-associated protein 2, putative [Plasmodium gallinaceum]
MDKEFQNEKDELTLKKRKKEEGNINDIENYVNKEINYINTDKNDNISDLNNKKNSVNIINNDLNDEVKNINLSRNRGKICPYLRTINRNLLDFDFEKLCSISLSNLHVYACLVCGLYFQGIGKGTYAYIHALEKSHYVFINLESCKTCCIPENYEIEDASLNDIKYFLKPIYTREQVEYLCFNPILGKSLDGADFLPGCVGLNNLKNTDYCNVIIQLLCTIIPVRNILLLHENKTNLAKNLIIVLSELIKKIYNPKNFKGVVSPHEFLQAVGIESKKNFKIGTKNDPLDFFLWVINKIHKYSEKTLKKKKKDKNHKNMKIKEISKKKIMEKNNNLKNEEKESSNENNFMQNDSNNNDNHVEKKKKKWVYEKINIIDYCFDGELIIKTKRESSEMDNVEETDQKQKVNEGETHEERKNNDNKLEEEIEEDELYEKKNYKIKKIPFRTLSLKLPNPPIFKSTTESNIIPQVSIYELLTKFDGETETFLFDKSVPSTIMISKLPKYLIFTIKRFSKNNFFVEKNGTIVNFVIKNLDMKDYIHQDFLNQNPVTKYNLIANIFHSGTVNQGSYKIHVLNQPTNEWYEIEDLHVISILPQLVLLSESCIQLYQRQDIQLDGEINQNF